MAPASLSIEDIDRAYAQLKAIGSRPAFSSLAHREPIRCDMEALDALFDDDGYEAALLAAEKAERAYGKPFFVSPASGPWILSLSAMPTYAVSVPIPPPRKGRKDSTHVPFYKSLPKFKRRR